MSFVFCQTTTNPQLVWNGKEWTFLHSQAETFTTIQEAIDWLTVPYPITTTIAKQDQDGVYVPVARVTLSINVELL